MRLWEKFIHEGMMEVTGRWGEGEIGVIRFAVSFYTRFLLGLAFACTLGWVLVIIDQRRDKLAQMTKGRKEQHDNYSYQEEARTCQAVHAH